MKKMGLFISIVASLFIGCGDNGSSISDENVNYEQSNIFNGVVTNDVTYDEYNVKAVDDEIIGAKVSASECQSSEELKNGLYVLKKCVSKPTYIIIQGGTIKGKNVTQDFPLILNTKNISDNNFVVTPLTTLVANASEDEIKDIAHKLGMKETDIFKDPKDVSDINVTKINQKINAVYLSGVNNGSIANKIKFIDTVKEAIKNNAKNGDFNVTEVAQNVAKKSQEAPKLFGLVFMDNIQNNDDVLAQIQKEQNPSNVTFLGLVFDDMIPDANITVVRADTNQSLTDKEITSDNYGKWHIELNNSTINMIKNTDFIIVMKAVSNDGKIVLESSMSSEKAREIMNKYKNITPSKDTNLIISNVTTAQNILLKKQNGFNTNNYEKKKKDIMTYQSDKVLKMSGVIKKIVKDVLDDNDTDIMDDDNNTFSFVADNINVTDDGNDVNISQDLTDINSTLEETETKDTPLLSQQLVVTNDISNTDNKNSTNKEENENITLETLQNKTNGVYYRILAYWDNDTFIREYQKIILIPGNYQIKTCYLKDNNTADWDCEKNDIIKTSNYSDGDFKINYNNNLITYSLEQNDSIFVNQLCKSYNLYDVTKSNSNMLNGEFNYTPEVFVDSFDIVDMFRRMPDIDSDSFKNLKDDVKNKSKNDVDIEMNRYIRNNIEDIKDYFSDDSTNSCNKE